MSKKLSVDLELNAQGYKKGIDEAKRGTAEYTNATRDLKKETEEYIESFGPLRKQLAAAKKEAQNLAAQFSALGKAERESEYGQELSQSLQIAIQKAAELQDVLGDTNEAITRAASDTQGWDAMKDAFDIGKDLATAYAGAVAKLTGNEKALKDMVATVAMAQGAANAAIKIGNALQKQSNIMIAIGNVQLKAKAIAEELATKKTIGATAAQRVFNAVAKANPYVLLATVAIAAATAIGAYMLATSKATTATERLNKANKEMHSVTIQGQKDAQSEITKLKLLYDATQDTTLSINARQSAVKQLQDQYPAYFGNLDKETIMVGNASSAYQQLVQDILAVAMAKAYEKKISSLAEQNVELEDQIEKDKELVELGKKAVENAKEAARQNSQVNGVGNWNGAAANISKQTQALNNNKKAMSEHEQQLELNKTQMEEYQKKIFEASDAIARLNANNSKSNTNSNSTKQQLTELEKYNKQLEDLEKKKQNIKDPFSDEGKKQLADINKEIARLAKEKIVFQVGIGDKIDQKDVERALLNVDNEIDKLNYKMSIGIEVKKEDVLNAIKTIDNNISQLKSEKLKIDVSTEEGKRKAEELQNLIDNLTGQRNEYTAYVNIKFNADKSELEKLNDDLKAAKLELPFLISQEDIDAQWDKINTLKEKIEKEEIRLGLKPDIKADQLRKDMQSISDIMTDAFSFDEKKFNFDQLTEQAQKEANSILEQYNRIGDAKKKLQKIIDDPGASDEVIAAAQKQYNVLANTQDELNDKLKVYTEINDELEEQEKKRKKTVQTYNAMSDALGNVSNLMSSLGDAFDSQELKVAGLIANAIGAIINGAALAIEQASSLGPFAWIGFSIAAMAQLAAMVAQIKNLGAQAGSYAYGGIVPGNSYNGDKLLAHVNSGEAIFTTSQQKRLFDIANGLESPAATPQSFTISSVRVQGRDLVLAIKNELKTTGQKL